MKLRMLALVAAMLITTVTVQATDSLGAILDQADRELDKGNVAGAVTLLQDAACGQLNTAIGLALNAEQVEMALAWGRNEMQGGNDEAAYQILQGVAGCLPQPDTSLHARGAPKLLRVSCHGQCQADYADAMGDCGAMLASGNLSGFAWCTFMAEHRRSVCTNRCDAFLPHGPVIN